LAEPRHQDALSGPHGQPPTSGVGVADAPTDTARTKPQETLRRRSGQRPGRRPVAQIVGIGPQVGHGSVPSRWLHVVDAGQATTVRHAGGHLIADRATRRAPHLPPRLARRRADCRGACRSGNEIALDLGVGTIPFLLVDISAALMSRLHPRRGTCRVLHLQPSSDSMPVWGLLEYSWARRKLGPCRARPRASGGSGRGRPQRTIDCGREAREDCVGALDPCGSLVAIGGDFWCSCPAIAPGLA